ncbi:hypothetical protein PIB30_114848, partial [Stylosanthes scabra]|nr:hypothetical protein [Stylosanthes scabra]
MVVFGGGRGRRASAVDDGGRWWLGMVWKGKWWLEVVSKKDEDGGYGGSVDVKVDD